MTGLVNCQLPLALVRAARIPSAPAGKISMLVTAGGFNPGRTFALAAGARTWRSQTKTNTNNAAAITNQIPVVFEFIIFFAPARPIRRATTPRPATRRAAASALRGAGLPSAAGEIPSRAAGRCLAGAPAGPAARSEERRVGK